MAAGGGPCIPLASRILKDRSKPWQGTARATCFMAESRIFRNLLSAMKHVGISSSLYRFPFVYSKRPNIGPADYWSLTLAEYSQVEVCRLSLFMCNQWL